MKTHDTPPAAQFTAQQAFGSCGEDPPYDEFSGTATPGSTVKIRSDHGGGTTTVGADGTWFVRVEFPTAPAGVSFPVKVTSSDGGGAVFNFTREP